MVGLYFPSVELGEGNDTLIKVLKNRLTKMMEQMPKTRAILNLLPYPHIKGSSLHLTIN